MEETRLVSEVNTWQSHVLEAPLAHIQLDLLLRLVVLLLRQLLFPLLPRSSGHLALLPLRNARDRIASGCRGGETSGTFCSPLGLDRLPRRLWEKSARSAALRWPLAGGSCFEVILRRVTGRERKMRLIGEGGC